MTLFTQTGIGLPVTRIVKEGGNIYMEITTFWIHLVHVMEFRQEMLKLGLE